MVWREAQRAGPRVASADYASLIRPTGYRAPVDFKLNHGDVARDKRGGTDAPFWAGLNRAETAMAAACLSIVSLQAIMPGSKLIAFDRS
jgi:hypothetical protein